MLGSAIGILTGWAHSPIAGTAVTSIIGLIGGLSIYLLGKKEYHRAIVSSCILILSFFLIVGTYVGAKLRGIEIEHDRRYEEWILNYKSNLQDNNAYYAAKLEVWKKHGIDGINIRNKSKSK
jgi:hypothetical protein